MGDNIYTYIYISRWKNKTLFRHEISQKYFCELTRDLEKRFR